MPKTMEELESELKTVTDKIGGLIDRINGEGLVPAFRCGHSQLLYPGNYLKEWGKLYGIGQGPLPVSEALDSDYDTAPAKLDSSVKSITQIMHGLSVTGAQMDFLLVTQEEFDARPTVLATEDPDYEARCEIILPKQLAKSGTLKALYAQWEQRNGSIKQLLARRG